MQHNRIVATQPSQAYDSAKKARSRNSCGSSVDTSTLYTGYMCCIAFLAQSSANFIPIQATYTLRVNIWVQTHVKGDEQGGLLLADNANKSWSKKVLLIRSWQENNINMERCTILRNRAPLGHCPLLEHRSQTELYETVPVK